MLNSELPPEAVERLRLVGPLACPRCHTEHGRRNYTLSVTDRGASSRQIGVRVRCSAGHVSLAVFVPLDGMVFHDIVADVGPFAESLPPVVRLERRGGLPMLTTDFVRVCYSADLDHLRVIVVALHRAGIAYAVLPSDRAIGTWEIEVAADDVEAAQAIVGDVRVG